MNNLYLDYVYESYRNHLLHDNTLHDHAAKKHAIELVLGTLSITNKTYFTNQDYTIH